MRSPRLMGPAVIGGIAAGAIIGSAFARPYYGYGYGYYALRIWLRLLCARSLAEAQAGS